MKIQTRHGASRVIFLLLQRVLSNLAAQAIHIYHLTVLELEDWNGPHGVKSRRRQDCVSFQKH